MPKKLNLFWILIDSARNYKTTQDDRGLPESVLNFALKQSLFYKNVVTSSPSTIQSVSSIMSSTPCYLLARSYNNYKLNFDEFDYFPSELKKSGYKIYGAIYFKHGREVMSDIFGIMAKKFYPKNLSHRKNVWNNNDVYNMFCNIIDKNDWTKPTMTYLHYNVRVDKNISEIIDNTLSKIKKSGLMENSVILINSDHGYPDKIRGWDSISAKKRGWGHDEQLFNDNILTPLVIRYPGCLSKKYTMKVSSIDIVPSLCELMNVKKSSKYYGENFLNPEYKLKSKLFRTDNRYVGQLPANTSYIKDDKKCIVYKNNEGNEKNEFYDLLKDPKELRPILDSSNFTSLVKAINKNNNQFIKYHIDFLFNKWRSIKSLTQKNSTKNILVVIKTTQKFSDIVKCVLEKLFPGCELYFSEEIKSKKNLITYDLVIAIIESEVPWHFKELNKVVNKFNFKKVIYLDNNGRVYSNFVFLRLNYLFIVKRLKYFKIDKLVFFDIIKRVLKKELLKPIK